MSSASVTGVLLDEANATTMTSENGPTSQQPDLRIIIDSPDDIRPITTDVEAVRSSVVFFSASLSMFAVIALVLFFRKCVTCPRAADRAQYYSRPADGAADAETGLAQATLSEPSKLDEIGASPSLASLAIGLAQSDEDLSDVRPPARRLPDRVESETPEALRLQDDDEDEDYV